MLLRAVKCALALVVPPQRYEFSEVLCFSLQVSLLNYVFLVSWAFALPYSHYRPLASSVCTVWTCVIIICKMLYQLKSIDPPSYSIKCPMVNMTASLCITCI